MDTNIETATLRTLEKVIKCQGCLQLMCILLPVLDPKRTGEKLPHIGRLASAYQFLKPVSPDWLDVGCSTCMLFT